MILNDKTISLPRVLVKHLLSSLPVMNIPIYDQNLLDPLVECVLGSHSDIIIKAIAAIFALHRVMSWRPIKSCLINDYWDDKNELYLMMAIPFWTFSCRMASTNSTVDPAASKDKL